MFFLHYAKFWPWEKYLQKTNQKANKFLNLYTRNCIKFDHQENLYYKKSFIDYIFWKMSRRRITLFYLNFTLSEESYCISDWVWSSSSLNVEICLQVMLNPKYSSPNSFKPPGLISILVSVPEHSLLGATFNHCHTFLKLKTVLINLKLFYKKLQGYPQRTETSETTVQS